MDQEEQEQETSSLDTEESPVKKSFIVRPKNDMLPAFAQGTQKKQSKRLFILPGILIVLIIIGGLLFQRFKVMSKAQQAIQPAPSATLESAPTPESTPFEPVLNRPEWSFEVLNGTTTSGLAKKVAVKIQDLGYQVVKTGNADKSNYFQTEVLVRPGFFDKIDLVIADLKDVIKIASVAGELKEGTASARIIIGKDSI